MGINLTQKKEVKVPFLLKFFSDYFALCLAVVFVPLFLLAMIQLLV
jgi:hypothetical protein